MLGLNIALLALLVILSSVFSSSETAIFSLSQIKVRRFVKDKKKGASTLMYLKKHSDKTLITILILNNVVNIAASSLATIVAVDLFGSKGVGIAIGVVTFLILLFGEIAPKSLALKYAQQIALLISKPLRVMMVVIYPVVVFLRFITKPLMGENQAEQLSDEELRETVALGMQEGLLNKKTANMLKNVLDFETNRVVDIMVPFSLVFFVDADEKLSEVVDEVLKYRYSRYPVFDDEKDEIIGILDTDSVLKHMQRKDMNVKVRDVKDPAFFVPETKGVGDLLREFQKTTHNMAIVVSEYGTPIGIVTVHSIMEAIV
jgi:Mg2+/Co2+ transporter CorB